MVVPSFQRQGWRYFAMRLDGDTGTETLIDPDLPLENVTISPALSGDSTISAKIDPAFRRLQASDGTPLLHEWSTTVYAECDGEIRCGGILKETKIDGPSLNLDIPGFTHYGRDQPYTGSGYKGIQIDALDAVRTIWTHLQAQPGANIGLELSGKKSGVKIGTALNSAEYDGQAGYTTYESGPFKLNWYESLDLQGIVDELAQETPFDYVERHYWDGETIRHVLDFFVPKAGRRRTDLKFWYGTNIFEPEKYSRNGDEFATGIHVLGAGEGSAMAHYLFQPPSRPQDRLRRIATVQDDSLKSKNSLTARAKSEYQWRSRLGDVDDIIVTDHPMAPLGSAQLGDEILLEGMSDWGPISIWVRITGMSYQPENGKVASYSIERADKMAD